MCTTRSPMIMGQITYCLKMVIHERQNAVVGSGDVSF